MVVILPSPTALTGTEHERIGTPLTCTVQAPHCAMPQPYLVPVRPTFSRNTHSSGVLGSTSTVWDCPLTVRRAIRILPGVAVGEAWHGLKGAGRAARHREPSLVQF